MEINVEKFKVKDGFPSVTYTTFQNDIKATCEASFNQIVHSDLSKAMDKLTIHLCLLTELVSEFSLSNYGHLAIALNGDAIHEDLIFSSFRCTGFSLSSDGVVLVGRKTLATKKVVNLVTPFALLNEDSDYPYFDHLSLAINAILDEVQLMVNGKFGGQQLNLFEEVAA